MRAFLPNDAASAVRNRRYVGVCRVGIRSLLAPVRKKNRSAEPRPLQTPPPRGSAEQHKARRPLRGVGPSTASAERAHWAQFGGLSGSNNLTLTRRSNCFHGRCCGRRISLVRGLKCLMSPGVAAGQSLILAGHTGSGNYPPEKINRHNNAPDD
jgi:hypothetical protein